MNWRDFILTLLAVAIGGFLALVAWTLIVKSQVSSSLANNPTTSLLASLFGPKSSSS